jgi:NhaA family Na+:H+ antiporter
VRHVRLNKAVDFARDHARGGTGDNVHHTVVVYSDYLCPYCRRLRVVLNRLRETLGDRLTYVFRHFPNETAHPGATFMSRAAEAADKQGRFWAMHDRLYESEPPLSEADVLAIAKELGLDLAQFERDLSSPETIERVQEDLAEGRRNGVAGTPTIFVDGVRYDGAWDFYSMLEGLERPVAAQVRRQARAFARLPASAGIVLLLAAIVALLCANSPLASLYHGLINTSFAIGPPDHPLSLTVGAWFSEGLLSIFFLLVGLEIRREMTSGALSDRRAAILPAIGAVGGSLAPAMIYLALNQGPTMHGWAIPTATDIAFALGVLALFGNRVPLALRVFVAALAVVDDVLSVLTLAVFYSRSIDLNWLLGAALLTGALLALNRFRVYISWPYVLVAAALWLALEEAGVHAALAGVILALFLPTRPAPQPVPLLAQAATALDALEIAERDAQGLDRQHVWDWAGEQLAAASERLNSPAERIERAVAPWSAYMILPLFAFSATGISFDIDFSAPGAPAIVAGIILGLVLGKPIGIGLASFAAVATRIAIPPKDVKFREFIGAACLCGIGDTVAILLADEAFGQSPEAAAAKIAVLVGSVLAAALGSTLLALERRGAETFEPERRMSV